MSIAVLISGKKARISVEVGHYRGETWKLLSFSLFERENDTIYPLILSIFRFVLTVTVTFGEEL